MNLTLADLLIWLATAGIALLAIGFIAGEYTAKIHYTHRHKGEHR